MRSASLYRDKIDVFVRGLAKENFSVLVLEGPAELDFLFDYSCERYGLDFVKNPAAARREALLALPGVMFVDVGTDRSVSAGASRVYLVDILFGCTDNRSGQDAVSGKGAV